MIEIEQTQTTEKIQAEAVEPEIPAEQATESNAEANYNAELDNELQVKLQPILLDSAISALGNTLAKLGKNDDLAFTEAERQALIEAWTPLLPSVSPMTNAVLVTVIVLSGKALLYAASKKQLKADTKALPVNSEAIKEAID